MTPLEEIFGISSGEQFEKAALELFRFQALNCPPYREYVERIGMVPSEVCRLEQIPFLPIEIFKNCEVYCGHGVPEKVFTSSTTAGGEPSRHYVARIEDYERTCVESFRHFYGSPAQWPIFALLPSYLEREGSSLIYMIDHFHELRQSSLRGETAANGGFYLYDHQRMLADMGSATSGAILFGVTYALLDLAEDFSGELPQGVVVMETGGMKGRREELPKEAVHARLKAAFGVETIHSEYGMAELSSQAYSAGNGAFYCPPWMKVSIRDLNDPFEVLPPGFSGGINIIDLANRFSCAFIQTKDVGRVRSDGSFFIEGRADRSEIRGCNLLVD